ncbi:MAG: SOS response-associated peptidase [Parvularculales bacterium]
MCGRYALIQSSEDLAALFECKGVATHNIPQYNIAPTQSAPVVCQTAGERRMVMMRWGLSNVGNIERAPLINARAETVADKPSFRQAFRRGRCLVPADAFYEWRKQSGAEGEPFAVARQDRCPFAMAAVRDRVSFTIVTTEANKTLRPYHHRMPVIIDEAGWASWLETPESEVLSLREFLVSAPDDFMEAWPISKRINRVAEDDPALLERVVPQPVLRQTSLF